MPVSYASLQLMLPPQTDAAAEKIHRALCAHLETQGFLPCAKESAERTIAFVRGENGWTLFDDQADRLDVRALDELGKALSRRLRVRAVGAMGDGRHRTLRLYVDGFVRDVYLPAEQTRRAGHALRWHAQLAHGHTLRELADAFSRGARGEDVFPELQRLLGLDRTTGFGFASLEDAALEGVRFAYFCADDRVRQPILERPWHTESKAAKAPAAPCRAEKKR